MILDALRTGGEVVVDDLDPAVCDASSIGAEGWDAGALSQAAFGVILSAPVVAEEPPLAPYAAHLGS